MGCRLRCVVDPVWRVLDWPSYAQAWKALTAESLRCGFVGLDLEWTTREVAPDGENVSDDVGDAPESRERAVRRRPKRVVGPVATVQLSARTVTIVFRYCDLWHLVKGDVDAESSWQGDPFAPASHSWPNHRMGEKLNSRETLASVLEDLNRFLSDAAITKVGVGIGGDKAKLQRDYAGQAMDPCVDLIALANHYIGAPTKMRLSTADGRTQQHSTVEVDVRGIRSLREMSLVFCGSILEKDMDVVKSDWGGSLGALSPMQVRYAARDAEVSFDACVGIIETAAAASDEVATVLSGSHAWEANCLALLAPLAIKASSGGSTEGGNGTTRAAMRTAGAKTSRALLARPLLAGELQGVDEYESAAEVDIGWCKGRAKPYYDNINVFDRDMRLVFTVDQAKAEWYVHKKGIAEVVEWQDAEASPADLPGATSPYPGVTRRIAAIKLSFNPDFSKFNDSHVRRNLEYFQQPKDNVCVVCGGGSSLVRFAVVPMMYRKYFPSVYMSHNSYDLLLLCTGCFARSRSIYDAERQRVSKDFGIPLAHLTPARLDAFEREIRLAEEAAQQREDERAADDLVAHHLPPELRAKVMREFAEVERHRACLLTILKYAKALHGHYITSGVDTGRALTGSRRYPIPEDKVALMRAYMEEHARRYPFGAGPGGAGAVGSADDCDGPSSTPPFAEIPGGPSSPEGVRWIMCGPDQTAELSTTAPDLVTHCAPDDTREEKEGRAPGAVRLRSVLTDFWLRENPEITTFIPRTVRAAEHDEVPLVDSHGFFIVRMLMEKYAGSHEKNGEHAVGQFIYRWRQAFLAQLQPRYLPKGWVAEDGILR